MAKKKRRPANRPHPAGTGGAARRAPVREEERPRRTPTGGGNRAQRRRSARTGPPALRRYAPWLAVGLVVIVAAVLVVAGLNRGGSTGSAVATGPAPAAVVNRMTSIPASAFETAGPGSGTSPVVALPSGQPPLTQGNLPRVIYVGADYCPFCAAERWALVAALGRFGTFHGLQETASASNDYAPNTRTFSFHGATYSSPYLAFSGVETYTNEIQGNFYKPLDTMTAQDKALITKYDAAPYVSSSSAGAIPFIDFGNQFISSGASFQPTLLKGLSMTQISERAVDPSTQVGKSVLQAANVITAAICQITGGKPGSVCTQPAVVQAKARIGKAG